MIVFSSEILLDWLCEGPFTKKSGASRNKEMSLLAWCERQPNISTENGEGDGDFDFILSVSDLTPSISYTLLLVPWYCCYNQDNVNKSFVLKTTHAPNPIHQLYGPETAPAWITAGIVQAVQQPVNACQFTGFS